MRPVGLLAVLLACCHAGQHSFHVEHDGHRIQTKAKGGWQECAVGRCQCVNASRSLSQHQEDRYVATNFFCRECEVRRNYVEIGALDGLKYSTTHLLEHEAHFGGLLIEGHPINARALQHNRGRSGNNVIAAAAVCAQTTGGTVQFIGPPNMGTAGVKSSMNAGYIKQWGVLGRWNGRNYTVPCKPIGAMIRNAGINAVHFFVLDVEGAELMVLQTMDWSIPVLVWSIELDNTNREKDDAVRALLLSHGYMPFGRKNRKNINQIFVRDPKLARARISKCSECARQCAQVK
eukprot:3377079-Prymnesium_polylepis.3